MAVNISGRHLGSNQLLGDVTDALTSSGIDPHRLIIEVTDTVLVDDPIATRNMQALRALGARIAIDDFGTGFTSIGQLPRLPVDTLKIDRSFVASPDPAHQELVVSSSPPPTPSDSQSSPRASNTNTKPTGSAPPTSSGAKASSLAHPAPPTAVSRAALPAELDRLPTG